MAHRKAYLMTLQEYLAEVVPVLSAYKSFLRKNKYFISPYYNSLPEWSYTELKEAKDKKMVLIPDTEYDFSKEWVGDDVEKLDEKLLNEHGKKNWWHKGETPLTNEEEQMRQNAWEEREAKLATGKYDSKSPEERLQYILDKGTRYNRGEPVPKIEISKEIIEKKNEYVTKLKDFFGKDFFEHEMGESDNLKSNKRSIKRAIDKGTYTKLLEDGEITPAEIENYAASADVKIPKKLFTDSIIRRENIYKDIFAKLPSVNRVILTDLINEIDKSFQPLADEIYERMTKTYAEAIHETLILPEISVRDISGRIDFYEKVFDIAHSERRQIETEELGRDGKPKKETLTYISGLSLKNGWEKVVSIIVLNYIESLKGKFIQSIANSFDKITIPITSFKQISLRRGAKGFEGEYGFHFSNGSSFIYVTKAIPAGGYNIQVFHFRYITDFESAILADGTRLQGPSLSKIIEHFSDKEASEKLFNPYSRVESATTKKEVAEALYYWFKDTPSFKNVRINDGKEDISVSYKPWNDKHYGNLSIYFKKGDDLTLEKAKEKATMLLDNYKAEKPKFEKGGLLDDNSTEYTIAKMAGQKGVSTEYIRNQLANRKKIELPADLIKETETGKVKETAPFILSPKEIMIVRAVYFSEMQGQEGLLEYYGSQNRIEYAEYHGISLQRDIQQAKDKIESLNDDVRFLESNKYPFDITQKYDGKEFLDKLNGLVRTNEGHKFFDSNNPNSAEYYEVYLSVYDKLEDYYEKNVSDNG